MNSAASSVMVLSRSRPLISVYVGEEGTSLPLRTNGRFGSIRPICRAVGDDRFLRIPLKKPSSIPSDGEACGVSEKGLEGVSS
jgi:hypothetical protein